MSHMSKQCIFWANLGFIFSSYKGRGIESTRKYGLWLIHIYRLKEKTTRMKLLLVLTYKILVNAHCRQRRPCQFANQPISGFLFDLSIATNSIPWRWLELLATATSGNIFFLLYFSHARFFILCNMEAVGRVWQALDKLSVDDPEQHKQVALWILQHKSYNISLVHF